MHRSSSKRPLGLRRLAPSFIALGLLFPFAAFAQAGSFEASPAEARTPATVTGRVHVLYSDDFDQHRSSVMYMLEDLRTHRMYHLELPRAPRALGRSGGTVTLRGLAAGNRLAVSAEDMPALELATQSPDPGATSDASGTGSEFASAATTRRALVMVASFQDVAAECTTAAIDSTMFTAPNNASVKDLYQETSLGQLALTGDVTGALAVADTVTGKCDLPGWASALDAQARAAGYDPAQYQNKVYVLPSKSSCAAGVGSVGGSPGLVYVSRCGIADVYAHEIGHNLGMNHAGTSTDAYGDTSDIMGYSGVGLRQLNAPHHEQLGWRSASQFQTVFAGGYYEIAPLELDPAQAAAAQVLRIAKPDTGETYYLSYRQPIGFDAVLSPTYYGLSVHRYAGTGGRTYLMGRYSDGQSFADATNGLTFTVIGRTTSRLTVRVDVGGASCAPSAPSVTLSPSSQSGAAGATLSYTLTVTNHDSGACSASSFTPSVSALPGGWTGAATPSALSLAPGASGQVTVQVTSAATAVAATYTFDARVSDAASSGHAASVSGSYSVGSACTRAAPRVTLSPASQTGSAGQTFGYGVNVTNLDSAACTASSFSLTRAVPSGWSASLPVTTMLLSPGQSASTTLSLVSPTTAIDGSYGLSVSAGDSSVAGHQSGASGTAVLATATDTQAPTAPSGLTASANKKKQQIALKWSAATDNVGVAGYTVWRDGAAIAQLAGTTYTDRPGDTLMHSYSVTAYDAAGNVSAASGSVSASLGGRR